MTERLISPARAAQDNLVWHVYPGQLAMLCGVLLLAAMAWLYTTTQRTVSLFVDGQSLRLQTHQQTLGALLSESHFKLDPADVVLPPLDTPLAEAGTPQLWLAQPVEVEVDGQILRTSTQSGSVADTLQALGIELRPGDRLWLGEGYVPAGTLLSELHLPPIDPRAGREPLRLSVERAVPVYLSDDGVAATVYTFESTVGDVLRENDFQIHPNDRISPALPERVSAGMHILIERSKPVTVVADGKTEVVYTREPAIGPMLSSVGIHLQGGDYTKPPVDSPLTDNMHVQVVRVREEMVQEVSAIPFAKLLQPDDNLEIDQQQLRQRGQAGEHRKLYRVVYEDGQQTQRTLEQEWDARAPVSQIIAYGRKLVMHEMSTPSGPVQYWRHVSMYATSYSPIRSGTPANKSWYGHTSSGLPAGKGVIAVDKSVVPWLARLYIPGYGIGTAGDTGNGVSGKLIDLGFDDGDYESWHDWVDVYWLWPPPDPKTIRWILPSYPVERLR